MEESVAILGAGNMGTALAQFIAKSGRTVRLWSNEADVLKEIHQQRSNSRYLPGVQLHPGIEAKEDIGEALASSWLVLLTVPSQAVRPVARAAAPHLTYPQTLLNVAKGLEERTHLRMSQVLTQELPQGLHGRIASMGGPAIASELVRGSPTAVVVAAADIRLAKEIGGALENEHFKVETTTDLCSVELGATLKNLYAIALGMSDGLGYGANTKAFLVSLALAEMARIGRALGANLDTLFGLAGLGDLLATGYSPHSRNRTLGEKLVTDAGWGEFCASRTVEGVPACRAVRALAQQQGIEAPLLEALYGVLFEGREPAAALLGFLRDFSFKG